MNLRGVAEWDFASDYRRFWWVIPPVLLAVVFYVAISLLDDDAVVVQERIRRTFDDAGSTPVIDIQNHSGHVRVLATRKTGVELVATRRGVGSSEEEAFNALTSLRTRIQPRNDRIELVGGPTQETTGYSEFDIEIHVPPGTRLSIRQANGPVTIDGVLGDMVVTVTGGDIVVELPQGQGFRLRGGGTLASDFPLQFDGAGPDAGFVTRDTKPVQVLDLSAPGSKVMVRAKN